MIEASYMTLVHHDDSHHQLHINGDVVVDFDETGQVLGIERIGGPVDMGTLAVNWQDNPRSKAAALWGIASNLAYSPSVRLGAALEALDLLFAYLEELDGEGEKADG